MSCSSAILTQIKSDPNTYESSDDICIKIQSLGLKIAIHNLQFCVLSQKKRKDRFIKIEILAAFLLHNNVTGRTPLSTIGIQLTDVSSALNHSIPDKIMVKVRLH